MSLVAVARSRSRLDIGHDSNLPGAIRSTCLAEFGGVTGRTIASPLSTIPRTVSSSRSNRENVNSSEGPAGVEAGSLGEWQG